MSRLSHGWRASINPWLALLAWLALLLAAVYGRSLRLPFLADDFFQLPFVERHGLPELLTTAEGLYYYRPLSFVIWWASFHAQGFHNPAFLHAVNLGLHLLNAVLVAGVGDRILAYAAGGPAYANWGRRFASGTLFLLFPFSYEAVPWVAAVMHLLVTMLVLLSLGAYVRFMTTRARRWAVASLLLALLAPFAHETGALVAPLLTAVELSRALAQSRRPGRELWRTLVWLAPVAVWAAIWSQVGADRGANNIRINDGRALAQNAAYAAQAAGYPLTWLGTRLAAALGASEFYSAGALSVIALAAAAWAQLRSRPSWAELLPWAWTALAVAPAIAFLDYGYFSAAPRTLMLASVGIAWLWADTGLALLAWRGGARPVAATLGLTLVAGLLVQNTVYVTKQLASFRLGGDLIHEVVKETLRSNDGGHQAIFVNLPSWLAPVQDSYALGQEGAALLPAADQIETLVSVHTGRPARLAVARIDAIRQEVNYHTGLIGDGVNWPQLAEAGGQVYVAEYRPETIALVPAGELAAPARAATLAHFEGLVSLLAAEARPAGGRMELLLTWRVDQDVSQFVTVFAHAFDGQGQLVAQNDGDPFAGSYPFWQWPTGSVVTDRRWLAYEGAPSAVRVGLYNWATGERLKAIAREDGGVYPDGAVAVPLGPAGE